MTDLSFRRPIFDVMLARIQEPRRFLRALAGPRQRGKTTLAQQVMEAAGLPRHYVSADEPAMQDRVWLNAQWDIGRVRVRDSGGRGALPVLGEGQERPGGGDAGERPGDEGTAGRPP